MEEATVLTHGVLIDELASLADAYPFLHVSSLGKSLVGRDIPLVTLGEGKKSVLYVGTHHGMEWITGILCLSYLKEFARAVTERRQVFGIHASLILQTRRILVVPMLNPDGVELQIRGEDPDNPLTERLRTMSGGDFSHWQANGRGVDLNHNYDAGFASYKAMEPALGIFGGGPTRFSGAHPESEPETAALCRQIRREPPQLLIALHTQGGEIYADYNEYMPKGSALLARRMAAVSGYTVARPEAAACFGGLKDWFIRAYDRPGFTLECGHGVNPLPPEEAARLYGEIRGILFAAPTWI